VTSLTALWLPILLSAVLVFVASSLIHMFSPWHKSDYTKLPNEEQAMAAIRPLNIPAGDYLIPRPAAMAEMKSPEFVEKVRLGPNWIVTVMENGPRSMATPMVSWFVYLIVVAAFVACLAQMALPAGAEYMAVFRYVAPATFLAHAAGLWPQSIWYHRRVSTTIKMTVDALIYGLLTAGVFGWLWPR
jgi:hypothetical protein